MQHDRVLALGFFDGIHLGHAALLNKTRERARELSLTPAAMSFDTHPDTLVFGTAVPLLNTMAERELLMRRLCGIEEVIFAHFDEAMMHMPWEVFIEDYLVRQLRARHVVCGHDFHFGDRGQGNPDRLREKCRALGVGCDVIPEIQLNGQCVSSTAIRALLRSGDCKTAARLLGHGQLVTGIVQKGAGRGAGLGFPTANLPFSPDVLVPAFGVYRAEAELDGRRYPACVNHRRPSDAWRAVCAGAGGQSDRLLRQSIWKGACGLAGRTSARRTAVREPRSAPRPRAVRPAAGRRLLSDMIFERIGASHPLFEASFTLYEASFPPNERRTREDHLRALQDEDFFPLGAVEGGKLLADVFLWETEDFCYLEHFAVQPSLRGHGTGSTLLRQLLQREKPLILEIELPEDEITCRRKHFYERNGLCAQPYRHVQLHFRAAVPLFRLSSCQTGI